MSSPFATNLCVLVLAGSQLATSFAFRPATLGWVSFGIACVTVVVSMIAFALPHRGALQRLIDLLAAIAATWMIVASLTFTGRSLRWLSFGEAAFVAGLAIIGLIAHEADIVRDRDRVHGHNGDGVARSGFQPHPELGAPTGTGG